MEKKSYYKHVVCLGPIAAAFIFDIFLFGGIVTILVWVAATIVFICFQRKWRYLKRSVAILFLFVCLISLVFNVISAFVL